MSFWTNKATYQPLRQNRWTISFGSFTYLLKSVQLPSFTINNTETVLLTNTYNYQGNLSWNPITIKLLADKELDTFLLKFNYGHSSETEVRSGYGHQKILRDAYQDYFYFQIKQLDEEGNSILIWELHNPFISNVESGILSYSSDDFVEVGLTIQYDYATLDDRNSKRSLNMAIADTGQQTV